MLNQTTSVLENDVTRRRNGERNLPLCPAASYNNNSPLVKFAEIMGISSWIHHWKSYYKVSLMSSNCRHISTKVGVSFHKVGILQYFSQVLQDFFSLPKVLRSTFDYASSDSHQYGIALGCKIKCSRTSQKQLGCLLFWFSKASPSAAATRWRFQSMAPVLSPQNDRES